MANIKSFFPPIINSKNESQQTPKNVTSHPFADCKAFKLKPPIPVSNIIIDNRTGQVIQDLTGNP